MTENGGFAPLGVVHPSDLSHASRTAFAHALKLALADSASFYLLHTTADRDAATDWSGFPGVRATLARWGLLPENVAPAEVHRRLGVRVAKIDIVDDDPAHGILRFLERHPASVIVLTTRGESGLPVWLRGSTAEQVARSSEMASLFVRAGARGFVDPDSGRVTLRRVLVPVDHEPEPAQALAQAWRLTRALQADDVVIELLHVGEQADAPQLHAAPQLEPHLIRTSRPGPVVETILQAAEGAELIVMATAGHHGFLDALRGSTTEQVLRRATCAVLAVPAL